MKITDTHALKSLIERAIDDNITNFLRVPSPGEVNDTFIIETDGPRLIARFNENGELSRFQKEKWCIEKAKSVSVNVPDVLAVGADTDYAYLLESYVEGSRADEIEDQTQVWFRIGQYAKALHNISVSGFGENLEDITQGNHGDWEKYIQDNLVTLKLKDKVFMDSANLTDSEVEMVLSRLSNLKDKESHFGLSHGDLSLKNAIVSDDSSVTLIDWGAAEAHIVPHYDIGVILEDSLSDDSSNFHQFLQGYEMNYDEYLVIKPEILSLMLLIAVDKLRWAIDKQPELIGVMFEQLKTRFEKLKQLNSKLK